MKMQTISRGINFHEVESTRLSTHPPLPLPFHVPPFVYYGIKWKQSVELQMRLEVWLTLQIGYQSNLKVQLIFWTPNIFPIIQNLPLKEFQLVLFDNQGCRNASLSVKVWQFSKINKHIFNCQRRIYTSMELHDEQE